MKGLLLQELYSMKQVYKVYGLAILIYFVMGCMGGNASAYNAILVLFCSMLIVNRFGYSEKSRWEMYAATMPISRKQMVAVFYAVGGCAAGAAAVLTIVMGAVDVLVFGQQIQEILVTSIAFLEIGILYIAVFIPILIHFGTDRGRIVMIMVYLIPFAVIYLLYRFVENGEKIIEFLLSAKMLGVGTVLLIAGVLISWKISEVLYCRKEF